MNKTLKYIESSAIAGVQITAYKYLVLLHGPNLVPVQILEEMKRNWDCL